MEYVSLIYIYIYLFIHTLLETNISHLLEGGSFSSSRLPFFKGDMDSISIQGGEIVQPPQCNCKIVVAFL